MPCHGVPGRATATYRRTVNSSAEVREFLMSRRARVTPDQAGLTAYGTHRRVPGLRRGEVAGLAGVSVEYYSRLERGNLGGVSDGVLDAIARALQLDEAERAHLGDLARAADPSARRPPRAPAREIRPNVRRVLDLMTGVPAIVTSTCLDSIAMNPLGEALFAPVLATADRPANHARFTFLDPAARTFWVDWDRAADDAVATLRTEAGRAPEDRALLRLTRDLAARSPEFRERWHAHDVRLHQTGSKHVRHPVVGEMVLDFEVLELPADPGLTLVVFSAEAGSDADEGLRLLGRRVADGRVGDRQA